MACRTRKPHYHYYEEIGVEVYCQACGVLFTSGYIRCHDNFKLCVSCYWEDSALRRKLSEDPL